ncbi:hypothetical protein IBE48_01600 [Francisella philomiragia]|uniref:Uncharacterized protein n=1 Tax=Francisella philomiragia TaxID=28110 RepID=A0AAW3DAL9_9GAMM|nr:hypothetical protein [Francisella philomiragia]KFJ42237.1 hypothetical protein DR78_753 [Francisella philomiragia]MBK2254634.1 hypothetical protein [Francisella philomiragia]MBK2273009.1 hypothetical protein [Francisella philomiragia]MBK2276850.1 hypothetical protein [Francisella philomiragia]MBK2280562.1 hypothetical protein [Francisella philomiragia]
MKKEKTWDDIFENLSKIGEDLEDRKDLPIQKRENMDTNLEGRVKYQDSEANNENQLLELLSESDKDSFNITEEDRQWLYS